MQTPDLQSVPRWKSQVVRRSAQGGRQFLFDPITGSVFEVDGIAARVCQLIDGQASLQAILSQVAAENRISEEPLKTDVLEFLADLLGRGLLE